MLVLAIDTATAAGVGRGRRRTARCAARCTSPAAAGTPSSSRPRSQYLCGELDVELDHLTAIAVGLGPGLFTGLRVGVTTAKVMAQTLRIPVVGVPSLDLVAYPLRHSHRMIVIVLDARRREVFHARYRPGARRRATGLRVRGAARPPS